MDAQERIDKMLNRQQVAEAEQEEIKTFQEQLDEVFEMLGWNE